jgi:hypothetical protein
MTRRLVVQRLLGLLHEAGNQLEFPPLDTLQDDADAVPQAPACPPRRLQELEWENARMRDALKRSLHVAQGLLELSALDPLDGRADGDDLTWPQLSLSPEACYKGGFEQQPEPQEPHPRAAP